MTATEIRSDGWAELERLGAVRIARPKAERGYDGWARRAGGAEWDWYYELDPAEREYVRRYHTARGEVTPDDLATRLGTDIGSAMAQWLEAVRLTRSKDRDWVLEWEAASWDTDGPMAPTPGVLVGPAEVALLLEVKAPTVHQWVTRGLLPEPWDIVSGTRLWPRHVILEWAQRTGRLADLPAEPLEQF